MSWVSALSSRRNVMTTLWPYSIRNVPWIKSEV
jgi:hypothetical protein